MLGVAISSVAARISPATPKTMTFSPTTSRSAS